MRIIYIDFEKHPGKFLADAEPKLAWVKDEQGKYTFLFQAAFDEMLADFAIHQPSLVSGDKKIPYDWTIYYLRKKALTEMISKEELAWILLNFNQKRGYYQLRGEEEEDNAGKSVEFYALKVLTVEATDEKKGRDVWYNVHLENGWIYRRSSSVPLDWEGQVKEFIVTTDLNPDGTPKLDKYGEVKRSFRAPKEDDWMLIKKRTEADIANTHKTVGAYIYDTLLQKPQQKIIGKLVKTVERKLYRDELSLILQKQCAFHAELQDRALYARCVEALYPSNEVRRKNIANRDFVYLLMDDILFYRKRLLNYILCIRFFIEVHSIVSASRFFHMPTYLRVVIECQSRFFPFFPAFSRNCPDYFLHTSGSSSFRSLSDLGAR